MMRFTAFISFPMILGLAFIAKEFILCGYGQMAGCGGNSSDSLYLGSLCPDVQPVCKCYDIPWSSGVNLIFSLVNGCLLLATIVATVHLGVVKLCYSLQRSIYLHWGPTL
jgi:hypothetical protein